jgi:hypothetical protein
MYCYLLGACFQNIAALPECLQDRSLLASGLLAQLLCQNDTRVTLTNNLSAGEVQDRSPNANSSVKKNFMAAQIGRPPRLVRGKASQSMH